MTPSGIEPATFRFVAQHLNHCATAVPNNDNDGDDDDDDDNNNNNNNNNNNRGDWNRFRITSDST